MPDREWMRVGAKSLLKRETVLIVLLVAFVAIYANLEVHQEIEQLAVDPYGNSYVLGKAQTGFSAYQFITMFKQGGKRGWTLRSSDLYLGRDRQGRVLTVERKGDRLFLKRYDRNGVPFAGRELALPRAQLVVGVQVADGYTILSKHNDAPFSPGAGAAKSGRTGKPSRYLSYYLSRYDPVGTLQSRVPVAKIRLNGDDWKLSLSAQTMDGKGRFYGFGYRIEAGTGTPQTILYQWDSQAKTSWQRPIGSPRGRWVAQDMALDGKDNLYLVAVSAAGMTAGNQSGAAILWGVYSPANGGRLMLRRFNAADAQMVDAIQVTAQNHIFIAAEAAEDRAEPSASAGSSGFLFKLATDGTAPPERFPVGIPNAQGCSTVDQDEAIYWAGSDERGFYLLKYDPAGRMVWAKTYRGHEWFKNSVIVLLLGFILLGPLLRFRTKEQTTVGH